MPGGNLGWDIGRCYFEAWLRSVCASRCCGLTDGRLRLGPGQAGRTSVEAVLPGSGSWRRAGSHAGPRASCNEGCGQKLESQLSWKAPPGKGATAGQALAWPVVSSVPGGASCTERCRQKLESQLSWKAPPEKGATAGQALAWPVVSSVPGGAGCLRRPDSRSRCHRSSGCHRRDRPGTPGCSRAFLRKPRLRG